MNKNALRNLRSLLCLLPACSVLAGTSAPSSKEVVIPPAPPVVDGWEITASSYGWLAGIKGTMGLGGFSAEVDVPFSKILDNLDMTAALQFEIKRDRWMLLLDGMYLRASVGSETPGRLFSSVGVEVEQVMAEADVGYRLLEGKHGFLDAFVGARYMYLGNELSLNLDNQGVQDLSADISQAVVGRVTDAVKDAVSEVAPEIKARVSSRISNAASEIIRQRVGDILTEYPRLPAIIRDIHNGSGPVNDAIKQLIAAKIAEQQEALSDAAAQASAQVAAAKAKAKAQLRNAVTRAEKQLAKTIESAIKENVPEHVSASKSWVDPIVGMRARYNFTDRCYALARADVGGFGVGSDLTWQLYGGLGYQLTQHVAMELGYRHMYVDYTDGNFSYDVSTSGVMLSLGYRF